MLALEDSIDRIAAATGFSGVVRVDRDGRTEMAKAYGFAHRGLGVANTVDSQFAIASGTKGLTALTIMSLVQRGRLEGFDAGVSFRTVHDPSAGLTYTVLSNTTLGAWPVAGHLSELLTT